MFLWNIVKRKLLKLCIKMTEKNKIIYVIIDRTPESIPARVGVVSRTIVRARAVSPSVEIIVR